MVQTSGLTTDPILVVAGATASGKSGFAERVAEEKNGEIINADSQQFYRGMDIGTGKVLPEDRRVAHWLLDICQPGEFMTAGEYARIADEVILEVQSRGKTPIIVGGTGLYLRALLVGFDELPKRDEAFRAKMKEVIETDGSKVLHFRLREIDPVSAAWISSNDVSRLVRYLEIHHLTGEKPSTLMNKNNPSKLRYKVETYWLDPPRDILRLNIQKRVREMFSIGWVDEVKYLIQRGADPRYLPNQPIGYAQIAQHLLEGIAMEFVEADIITKTNQYAKRQQTFFNKFIPSVGEPIVRMQE